jgi:hypothetical protein
MQNKQRQKWQIIVLKNITTGEARTVNFKVDDLVRHCKGLIFSCNETGQAAKNYVMGDASLFINNRKVHPLHYTIHAKPLSTYNRKRETLELKECIEGGSFIQGYYMDLGISSHYPYTLKIYLDCVADNG